jgi:pyroglutamyl-peptidase
MRVVLTAFEPFDGTGLNSSLEGCRRFLESSRAGIRDLRFVVLPVEYGADTAAVEAALASGPCDVLLHTGQATGAAEIRVERVAVNVRYGHASRPEGGQRPILAEGPAALFATVPVEALARAIASTGAPARASNHAGVYLCNHVLYRSLLRAETAGPRVGFLHVPALPEQAAGGPSLAVEAIAGAIEATVACLREHPGRSPFDL